MIDTAKARKDVAAYARRIRAEGLVLNFEGNVSLRVPSLRRVAITPSQKPKSRLSANDIHLTDYQGKLLEGRGNPSIEAKMHLAIYNARRDVDALIHTHSPCATALAASGEKLPAFLDEQAYFLRGDVRCAKYAPSGSTQLARFAVKALGDRMAVLLANHGVLCCGRDLEAAFRNAMLVERSAKIYLLTKTLGGPKLLPRGATLSRYED